MILCRVLGTVTATFKHPAFSGLRLMVVQPVDERSRTIGASFIAIDHICSAGPGDQVLVLREGNGVRQVIKDKSAPIRSAIVGWVDEVSS